MVSRNLARVATLVPMSMSGHVMCTLQLYSMLYRGGGTDMPIYPALSPLLFPLGQPMTQGSGNFPEQAACIGHPSSFIIGPQAEPNSLSRQDFAQYHHTPLSPDMGLRFITSPVSEDPRYVIGSFMSYSYIELSIWASTRLYSAPDPLV
jgi:hypothetical protein